MNAEEAAASIRYWFDAAVRVVDPEDAVTTHLQRHGRSLQLRDTEIEIAGRLFIAAIGKAALGMSRGASNICGDLIDCGVIITKEGHLQGAIPERFQAFETAHPIPDQRSIAATECLLERLGECKTGDVVLALLSGGGSALMEAPVDGVSLEDIATTTDLLLRAGAPIHDLNAVRIPLSKVKGGGLRRSVPDARFITLLLSDVLGNDMRVIASGPTAPTDFSRAGAIDVLDRYGLTKLVPGSVKNALSQPDEQADDAIFRADVVEVVADNNTVVSAFAALAERNGKQAAIVWNAKQGEARDVGREWVELLTTVGARTDVVLGGGEATVTVRGDGIGGRNTEFALAAGLELERREMDNWIVASLATDGQDAMTGVAGAVVSIETMRVARAAGIDPEGALADNDSLSVFRAAGGCVETGPTGTNVNDIYVAVRVDGGRALAST